jgi:hypothetical protein
VCSTTAGAKVKGRATVTIQNNLDQPVANATVSGTFSGGYDQPVSGVTAANGTVTLQTTASVKKSGLQFTFCVNNVVHSSVTYAPAEHVETCDQY